MPWYADHASDPDRRYESFLVNDLVPWVQANLAVTGQEEHWLVGLSKSGFGAVTLLFRNPARLQRGRGLGFPGRAGRHDRVRHARQLRDGGELPEQLSPDRRLDRRAQDAVPDGAAAVAIPRRRDRSTGRRRSWRRWTCSRGACRLRASSSCARAAPRAATRGRRAGCRRRWPRCRRCGTRPGTTSIEPERRPRPELDGGSGLGQRRRDRRQPGPVSAVERRRAVLERPGLRGRSVLPDHDHRRDRGLGRGRGPGQGLAGPGVLGGDPGGRRHPLLVRERRVPSARATTPTAGPPAIRCGSRCGRSRRTRPG